MALSQDQLCVSCCLPALMAPSQDQLCVSCCLPAFLALSQDHLRSWFYLQPSARTFLMFKTDDDQFFHGNADGMANRRLRYNVTCLIQSNKAKTIKVILKTFS